MAKGSSLDGSSWASLIATFKSLQFGTVAAIAVEIHFRNFDVSAATTNKTAVIVSNHRQEILPFDTVAALYRLNRARSRFHPHTAGT